MKSKPSITFDHFKADNGDNFLVITIHFVNQAWQLDSRCLDVINLEDIDADHTAKSTAECLDETFSSYNLNTSSIFSATTDTTNTMPATLRLLDIQWIGCAAHILQLALKDAFKVQPILNKVVGVGHKIGSFFHSSSVGQAALTKNQLELNMKESRPPLDCVTRFLFQTIIFFCGNFLFLKFFDISKSKFFF